MANKKRSKQRRPQRALSPAPAPEGRPGDLGLRAAAGLDVGEEPSVPAGAPAPARGAAPGATRGVALGSSVTGPRRVAPQLTPIDIDARVPYFAADLRRIAITATVMVVVIVGGSFLLR